MNKEKTADERREKLGEFLEKIGWKISGRFPNSFIIDHNGRNTGFCVLSDRIEDNNQKNGVAVSFFFKGLEVEMLEENTVSVGTQECFVLFMNHDLTK